MQELRSELLSSSSPSPSSASQGWGSWQARPLCVNLCPLHTGSLLMGEKDRPEGEQGQGRSPGKQPLRCHPHSPSAASSHEGRGGSQAPQCPHKNMANTLAVPQRPDPRCHSGKVPHASLPHTHHGPSGTLTALHTVLSYCPDFIMMIYLPVCLRPTVRSPRAGIMPLLFLGPNV